MSEPSFTVDKVSPIRCLFCGAKATTDLSDGDARLVCPNGCTLRVNGADEGLTDNAVRPSE